MTNTCQICRATDTETFTHRVVIVHGSIVMCVDRIPCVARENAKRVRDEARWAIEDEAQWAQEEAEQEAEDAVDELMEANYNDALWALLY